MGITRPRRLNPMSPRDFRKRAKEVLRVADCVKPGGTRDYYVMASGAIYWRRSEVVPDTAVHAGCFTAASDPAHVLDSLCEAHAEALAAHLARKAAA